VVGTWTEGMLLHLHRRKLHEGCQLKGSQVSGKLRESEKERESEMEGELSWITL
jgi:hypothetical protein